MARLSRSGGKATDHEVPRRGARERTAVINEGCNVGIQGEVPWALETPVP